MIAEGTSPNKTHTGNAENRNEESSRWMLQNQFPVFLQPQAARQIDAVGAIAFNWLLHVGKPFSACAQSNLEHGV